MTHHGNMILNLYRPNLQLRSRSEILAVRIPPWEFFGDQGNPQQWPPLADLSNIVPTSLARSNPLPLPSFLPSELFPMILLLHPIYCLALQGDWSSKKGSSLCLWPFFHHLEDSLPHTGAQEMCVRELMKRDTD